MGIGQSNMMSACGVPADDTLKESMGRAPTEQELNEYIKEVKSVVVKQVEPFADRFQRYLNAFEPNVEFLQQTAKALTEEMQIGLANHQKPVADCSLKMLDSFVPRGPNGKEKGIFYALDFGGSNFRILRVDMDGDKFTMKAKKASLMDCKTDLPKGLLDPKATATMMFDFFATVAKEFLEETGDLKSETAIPLGFTFSYPCVMRNIKSADLIVWTKGFETGRDTDDPVEKCDVGSLMNMAFKRHNVPLEVNCIANDTVGTLLSGAFSQDSSLPECAIGMILGTGVNAAYIDDRAPEYGYKGTIINMESGAFNRLLPSTNIDHEVDFADVGGRGRQHYEKMVSGAYLGEICRRVFIKILQYKATPKMYQLNVFTSEDASTCIGDKSDSLIVVARKCKERFDADLSGEELRWVQAICEVVFRRSAALAAMMIAGTAIKTGHMQEALGGLTVAIDGSLWKCNAFYRDDIRKYLQLILGKKQSDLIHLVNSDDGSGVGAAILAAIIAA